MIQRNKLVWHFPPLLIYFYKCFFSLYLSNFKLYKNLPWVFFSSVKFFEIKLYTTCPSADLFFPLAHRKRISSHRHAAQRSGHVPAQTGSALSRWETLRHGQRRREHNSGGRRNATPQARSWNRHVWQIVVFFSFQDHYGSWVSLLGLIAPIVKVSL